MEQSLHQLRGWRKAARGPSALADCVLIVPTYRRPMEIIRLLDLLTSLPDAPGEVLIIDGSPEPAVEAAIRAWARERELSFELSYVSSPAGLTRQRNVGLDASTREFVFYLDDDCLPEPGYFRALRQVFREDAAQRVGGVRGFMTNGIDKPLTRMWRLRFALRLVPRGRPGEYFPSGSSATWDMVRPFRGTRPVDVLAGGVSAYRRQVFARHRFSEFFYGYAQGEDLEMSLRIGKEWKLLVCGDARLDHHHAAGGRPAGFALGKMAVRNRYFIWKRHSPDCRVIDKLRFWLDHALVATYNAAVFLARPWRPYNLFYAAGTCRGVVDCWISPPRHEEPPARRQYEVLWEEPAPAQEKMTRKSPCQI